MRWYISNTYFYFEYIFFIMSSHEILIIPIPAQLKCILNINCENRLWNRWIVCSTNCDCGGGDQIQGIVVVQSIVLPRLLTTLQLGPRHRSQSAKRKSRQHNIFGFFLGIYMGWSKCEPSTHMSRLSLEGDGPGREEVDRIVSQDRLRKAGRGRLADQLLAEMRDIVKH